MASYVTEKLCNERTSNIDKHLSDIKTNHLPHIQSAVTAVETRVHEIKNVAIVIGASIVGCLLTIILK